MTNPEDPTALPSFGGPQDAGSPPPPGPGLAIGSLACSVIGLITCLPLAIAGIVMGHIAYKKAGRGEATRPGLAIAGFVVGYVAVVVYAIAVPIVLHKLAQHGAFG